jgi:hypothetical protein
MMKKLLQIGKVKGAFNIVAVLGFFASRIDSVASSRWKQLRIGKIQFGVGF